MKKILQFFMDVLFLFLFPSSSKLHFNLKGALSSFTFDSLCEKKKICLSSYQGSVILIVNTASKCGFRPQYKELQEIYSKYKDEGFVIIGIPCGDFQSQEFKKSEDIQNFCSDKYRISFPLSKKYSVVGEDAHPFFLTLCKEMGKKVLPKWNFYKYLINREGVLLRFFPSTIRPTSNRFIREIEALLY